LVFISRFSGLFEQGEGLAPFHDRGRLARHFVRPWRPRSLMSAKGNRASTQPKPRGAGKRQADRSDVRQEIRPQKSPNRFRAFGQADGRQPFMPRVSHEPLPLDASLPFCPCDANAAAFRQARDSAFHPATCHRAIVSTLCKERASGSRTRR
jgi:hypothetical protein